jgi:8-oxo-dGTP pyrophosphatase MutT (NUDIX family)
MNGEMDLEMPKKDFRQNINMRIFATGIERKKLYVTSARWGLAGAGILYYCPSDNTILLLERSKDVEDPGLWGIPGGAVKSGKKDNMGREDEWCKEEDESPDYSEEELRDAAYSETYEEMGHLPEHDKEEGFQTTINNKFPYTTFLMTITPQQKINISRNIQLNWENDDFEWFRVDFLPENIHPGVASSINQLILSKQNSRKVI